MGYTLSIKRSCEQRDPRVRPALFQLQYAAMNLAAVLGGATTSTVRTLVAAEHANWTIIAVASLFFLCSAATAAYLFTRFASDKRFWAPTEDEHPFLWRNLLTPVMGRYLLLLLALVGTRVAFSNQSNTLGKYMIRRFDESTLFALFQTINPLLMVGLALGMPLLHIRAPTLVLLVLGSLTQALAPMAILIAPLAEWPVVVYVVMFTLGEALAMPLLAEYSMQLLPKGQEGFFLSVGQVRPLSLS
jgi:hypothetical protein